MSNRFLAATSLVVVLIGLGAMSAVFVFESALRHSHWINQDAAAWAAFIICIVGCILGLLSWKHKEGKVASILGSLLVMFFMFQLLRTS